MTSTRPRFTNSLDALLGTQEARDLLNLHDALQALVKTARAAHGVVSMPHNGVAAQLLLFVPLTRDLDKLLHQRSSVRNFRSVLGRLAYGVLRNMMLMTPVMARAEVRALPLPAALLGRLAQELTPAQVRELRGVMLNDDKAGFVHKLRGNSIGELADSFTSQLHQQRQAEQQRLVAIFKRVKEVLPPEDYALLRKAVLAPRTDAELRTPLP